MYKAVKEGLQSDCFRFYEHFTTSRRDGASQGEANKLIKAEFQKQMGRYAIERKLPSDYGVFNKIKMTFSGKAGGSKDDLCVIFQLVNYWGRIVLGKPSLLGEGHDSLSSHIPLTS